MNRKQKIGNLSRLTRREFLGVSSMAAVFLSTGGLFSNGQPQAPYTLPPLPYGEKELEPIISSRTLSFHYGKHHKGYVNNLNKLTANTEFADFSLEKIITSIVGRVDKTAIFNNAAQTWNHSFY